MPPVRTIPIGGFRIGGGQPLVLIAGPCVIESERHAMRMAERLVKIAAKAKIPLIFKASYDKANRSHSAPSGDPARKRGSKFCERSRLGFECRC